MHFLTGYLLSLSDESVQEQNGDAFDNQADNVLNSLLRLRRDPGPPTVLDSQSDSDSQEDPDEPGHRTSHGHHLIDHMLHEIQHGHVTQEKISHWWKEIQTALEHGSLDMDDVNQFINTLKDTNNYDGENCCLFG